MTVLSMSAGAAAVEVDACAAQSTRQLSLLTRAAPDRKRSTWDYCSGAVDSEFPDCDFHEERFSRTGEQ